MEFLTRRGVTIVLLWLAGVGVGLGPVSSGAQTAAKPPEREELPLSITADRLEVEQNQQVISFLHNVVARYKDMILYADVLKIFYQSQTPAGSGKTGVPARAAATDTAPSPPAAAAREGQKESGPSPLGAVGIEKISRIEALGKVRMVQGDRVATGDKAIYFAPEEKLVLMGNPQLWRGDNSLRGHEIVFYLKENRAVVTGEAKKRVEAVLHPSQKVQLPGKNPNPAP